MYTYSAVFLLCFLISNCICTVTFERKFNTEDFDQKPESTVDHTFKMLQLFDKIDLNSDGVLSKDELDKYSSKLSKVISNRQLANEMATIDRDRDGKVTFTELLAAFSNEVGEEDASQNKEPLKLRFNIADKNKDGMLSLDELGDLVNPSRNPDLLDLELNDVIKAHDEDGDGKISFTEYKKYRTENGEDETQSLSDFKQFDKNSDGYLTKDELAEVYKEEGEFDSFPIYDDVTSVIGSSKVTRDSWKDHANELSKTAVTDFGEMLLRPEDYDMKFQPDPDTAPPPEVHAEL
ncbi:hypothetical protein MACK_002953 [Theileria orientalis]|uniref:EF-hand domain-containing protein n=1 Tax=Theileria orientalis TaxID=68886 RepID=A0A976MEE2_THEOR|nr:hypothetical protein MACK_002953 [Theileria orientalis]